ncbi:HTH-type transcriptional activator RhaS [Aquisphaera giovannonii]|uniref:HTH-type transcriptional activator RhaS n=1 Tax=Aquisphaera giovannonii TaxID=406548 RepID=A0A5B9W1P6_9BACT|nr:AraC family transcriptional regulator [Aquisphaera giovannonii]QEH34154.1 HTH-type transcriptional activator RhaS [Aquisphaera giovannonii]
MTPRPQPLAKPEIATRVSQGRYFYVHGPEADDPGLVVVCGGREACAADYEVDRSDFPYYGLEWVERGRGELWLAGRRHRLGPGAVFCYGPGVRCRIRSDPGDPPVKCFLDLAGEGAAAAIEVARLRPGRIAGVASPADLSEVFDAMHRDATRPIAEAHPLAAAHLRVLLLKIRAGRVPLRAEGTARQETFLRCRQHLRDRFRDHRDIESAAAAMGVTPTYLCRLFREHGEASPYQFLLRLRMNEALDILLSSGGQVKQTSFACGFRDPSHFARLFKRVHGLTPRELVARTGRGRRE